MSPTTLSVTVSTGHGFGSTQMASWAKGPPVVAVRWWLEMDGGGWSPWGLPGHFSLFIDSGRLQEVCLCGPARACWAAGRLPWQDRAPSRVTQPTGWQTGKQAMALLSRHEAYYLEECPRNKPCVPRTSECHPI